jgi:tRNA(Ile)-lysidine synthase
VARVLERVTATAREHDMFSPGGRVLVAVSGGPDSTCLLHSLYMLRRLFKIDLEVFHFDHRLRPDSDKDAQYVKRTAGKLGLPLNVRVATTKPERGRSVEDWAREARFSAGWEVAIERALNRLALGHTLDDQAETVLIHLFRGRGLRALAGMRPAEGPMIRPLLEVRRHEVEAFCRALHIRPRRDPTNDDTRFLRNAIRLEVVPTIERVTGRDVKGPVARSAELLRSDLDELHPPTPEVLLGRPRDDGFELSVAGLESIPSEMASRLAHRVLLDLVGRDTTKAAVDAVLDLARGRPGRRRDLPGGLIASREKEYVRLSRASPGASAQPAHVAKGESRRERPGRNQRFRVARPGDRS